MKLALRLLLVLAAFAAAPLQAQIVSCAANGSGGDLIDRGFYVQNYPSNRLGLVTLQYVGTVSGTYNVTLTANSGAYNGPLIGSATLSFPSTGAGGDLPASFDFHNAAVTPGSTIAFTQTLNSGPGAIFMDTGNGALGVMDNTCPNVFETSGTTPPLDVFRRNSLALTINSSPVNLTAVPTLDGWALFLLSLGVAGSALLLSRRRG
jgi:hypothetical protein